MGTRTRPVFCCLQETYVRPQDTYRLKVRGWKNIFHANGKLKKAGVAILISDRTDLKIKKMRRDKERYYLMTKASIQDEDITAGSLLSYPYFSRFSPLNFLTELSSFYYSLYP